MNATFATTAILVCARPLDQVAVAQCRTDGVVGFAHEAVAIAMLLIVTRVRSLAFVGGAVSLLSRAPSFGLVRPPQAGPSRWCLLPCVLGSSQSFGVFGHQTLTTCFGSGARAWFASTLRRFRRVDVEIGEWLGFAAFVALESSHDANLRHGGFYLQEHGGF